MVVQTRWLNIANVTVINCNWIQIIFTEYLTRKIQEGRNNEKFLKRTIEEKQRGLEESQRKIKDLQIRLIR